MTEPKTWVLLRGLGREARHWGPFTEQFKAAFREREIHLLDLPGVGDAAKDSVPLSTQGIAEYLNNKLNSKGPVGVFGLSFGGMVALEWAAKYPSSISHLVLVNSSVKDETPWHHRLQGGAVRTLSEVFALKSEREREEKILRLVSRTADRQNEVLQLWIKIAKERSVSRSTFLRYLWAANRFSLPRFKKVRPKILCLAGMGDSIVDPSCSKKLGEALKAEVHFHPWGGHELTLDDPTWVLSHVQEWIDTPSLKS